jgi:hypothetical protein
MQLFTTGTDSPVATQVSPAQSLCGEATRTRVFELSTGQEGLVDDDFAGEEDEVRGQEEARLDVAQVPRH